MALITSSTFTEGALVLLLGTVLVVAIQACRSVLPRYIAPASRLPGPPAKSLLFGDLLQIGAENADRTQQWLKQYGRTFRLYGPLKEPRVYTSDLRAINHVLTHSMDYYKARENRIGLTRFLGDGVLVVEGPRHKKQRHIMNPAFGLAQIRELSDIIVDKANRLAEYWNAQIASAHGAPVRVNAMEGLGMMTLDVIGLAGFNFEFDALNPAKPPNDLQHAFHVIFKQPPKSGFLRFLGAFFPTLETLLNPRARQINEAKADMQRIGRAILQEKKGSILREKNSLGIEKKDVQGRDLLTLLIKANMAVDIRDNQRLTDDEVIAQVPTFLVAGHETTASATTWCLGDLSQSPAALAKLRAELLSVPTDTPTMEDLNALPYLDLVVRESLRLHPVIANTARAAEKDDVLPLAEPVTDAAGNVLTELPIAKGTVVHIPIMAIQRLPALWGEDAAEFRPERWENPPDAIASMPGAWSNILTFLGGPHACIGYRFALVEMKALLFAIIRNFEFELAVPKEAVKAMGLYMQRPVIDGEREKGAQLPIVIRPYSRV